ncbi:MAG: acyl-CoA dehydrogenase family protein [Myxococcales bacterium]|nr:acyl-CoA dehydrogenase family protein [Myxococcales bacterium]
MDLRFSETERRFRDECREWLAANVPAAPLPSGDTAEGFALHLEWERALFAGGWSAVSWPREYGGRGASLFEWLIFEEEYYLAGAPQRVTQNGIFLLAPSIFEFGTAAQRDRFLRPMAAAEQTWAQAWSEPNSGSDLASVVSRARRVDGGWALSGQKTWSTRAAFCDMAYGLFRTDPSASRHRGLTYFLFPLDAPGVTVRGVDRLDGDEGFAEIFLDDVFVADDLVLGEVDRGWEVAMATTSSERGLSLRSPGRFMATSQRLVSLAQRTGAASEAATRDAVLQAWCEAEAYRWYTYGSVTRMLDGEEFGASSSMNKVFWSEMDVRVQALALSMLGPAAEVEAGAGVVDDGQWSKGFQFALAGPIYAGTNEIQRSVIAQRVLGLPRK